jgi:cytochrome subunit of sulfide dehydrogenase
MSGKYRAMSALLGYAVLALAVAGAAGAADVNALAAGCAECHGKDGASTESDVPIIGGYSAKYLADSLANYKSKARPCPQTKFRSGAHKGDSSDMCTIAGKLADEDMKAIAGYLASKPFVRARQSADAAKAARGQQIQEAHCKKCHEDGGSSPDDDAGILAGQWMPYIRHTFEEFGSGQRPVPKKMKPKFSELTKDDIEALVNYFGGFK